MEESQDVNSFGGGEYGDASEKEGYIVSIVSSCNETEGYIRGRSSVPWGLNYLAEHL